MLNNPTKLEAVKPCEGVDKKILSFISKNKSKSPFPLSNYFTNSHRKNKIKSRPVYKTSLADWRSLYEEQERPKTQSLISKWVINKHRTAQLLEQQTKTFNKNERAKSNTDTKYKTGFHFATKIKQQSSAKTKQVMNQSLLTAENPEYSKTAMNFYTTPLKSEVDLVAHLTARIQSGNSPKNFFRSHIKKSPALTQYFGNKQ